jgi:eukaryotic-like serine/threonine-protein kinase
VIVSEGVGRLVGDRYHIVREIGRGGMGVVYLGRDLRRDMDVAIKFRHIAQHEAQLWLKREFRAVASLRHANLVELYELVAHERSCYFTMEYLEGVDPRQWVARRRVRVPEIVHESTVSAIPLQQAHTELSPSSPAPPPASAPAAPDADFSRVRAVLAQLAEGVAFLHARGVIHRDIKPSNVVVANDTVKLLDFGLALDRERVLEETARETRLVGTVAYLAPEYVERLEVTPAIDVYALGVLAFELVTGAPPFGGTLHVLSRLARKLELPRASTLAPAIPADLDVLIDEMLRADPAHRPSALDVATRLTGALTQPRPVRRMAPFIGRARELAQLGEAFADREPRGRLIIVTGGSGSGKTALVEEALTRARQSGTAPALVWRGRCHERERVPYRAFDFVIDDLATELAGDACLAQAIEHAGALGRVFPSLGAVLGAGPAATDLRVERERAPLAMTQLFDLVLGTQRGLVVIDDLQWADEDSLELLALLVELVTRPLTIVATWTTDGGVPPAIASLLDRLGEGSAQVIALAPLGLDELTELVGAMAPHVPAHQLVAAARIAAGSPYLAEVIGRELVIDGVAATDRVEQRRLERLSPAQRDVAELTALATGATTFEQLRALADLPSQQLQSALRGLEDDRVIRATPSPTGDPVYTFYHQRLRDAAHALMSPQLRQARHARFAQLLERDGGSPDQLSFHHEHAGDRARAAHWAIVAANAARAQLAWSVAADGYARAIALGAEDCRAARAECWFLAGKLAAAAGEFEALATTGGDHWRVRAAEAYIKLGELDRGLALVDRVLAVRGQPRARGRIASTLRTLGVAARWLGPVRTSPARRDDVLVAAYRVIASFLSTPYPLEAFEYVLRGIASAERAGDRDAHALGMAMLGVYLATGSLGRFGDRALARAHELSSGGASGYPRMVTAGAGGIVATLRGDWAAMRRAHAEAQRICDRLGLERSWEASFLRTYEALGEHYAGAPRRAVAILEPLAEASDDMFSRALLGSHRGRALVLAGDLAGARAVERALAREPAARHGLAAIYRSVFAGELALAERDWLRAEAIGSELARSARDQWLSALPAISAMIDTLLATAELGRCDRSAARRARRRARALYRRGRSSFYAATALRLWGQAERRLGDRTATTQILARAAAVASDRGGKVDRLAIAALITGGRIDDELAPAVLWSCAGMIEEGL